MSDRKKNNGWRAENPNRHKREIENTLELSSINSGASDEKRKSSKEKNKKKYS